MVILRAQKLADLVEGHCQAFGRSPSDEIAAVLDEAMHPRCGLPITGEAVRAKRAGLPTVRPSLVLVAARQERGERRGHVGTTHPNALGAPAGIVTASTHDLVVAHDVIGYSANPHQALADIATRVQPGGRLSISFGNGAAQALRHAVITHDLTEALRLAQLPASSAARPVW
jgi:predicted TPR repeat methyltransferase